MPESLSSLNIITLNMLKNKWLDIGLIAAGSIIALLLVFSLGLYIGEKKENFNHEWAENYSRFFGSPRPGFLPAQIGGQPPVGFNMNAFGNGGIVLKVNGSSFVIKGNDNNEKVIAVSSSTTIRKLDSNIQVGDIQPGNLVIIIGQPDSSGQIQARFIRVFPSPNASSGQSSQPQIFMMGQ